MKNYIKLFEEFVDEAQHIDKHYVIKALNAFARDFRGETELEPLSLRDLVESVLKNIGFKFINGDNTIEDAMADHLRHSWDGNKFNTTYEEIMDVAYPKAQQLDEFTEVGNEEDVQFSKVSKARPYIEILSHVAADLGIDSKKYITLRTLFLSDDFSLDKLISTLKSNDLYDKYSALLNQNENIEEVDEKKYPWEQCIKDQKAKGHSEESANKICGWIKSKNA